MRKKLSITLLFTAVVAIVTLFAATDVFAQCLDPECFSAAGCEISVVRGANGEFPLIIDSSNQNDLPYSNYAQACRNNLDPDFPCTVFAYNINECNYSQLSQALANPSLLCPDNPFDVKYWDPEDARLNGPGDGDSATGWYSTDDSTQVLTWPSHLPTNLKGFFMITSNNVSPGPRPAMLKSGKKLYYGTLLAPECQGVPPELRLTTTGFTVVDPATGQIYHVVIITDQLGAVQKVEVCTDPLDPTTCQDVTDQGRDQREVYTCLPLENGAEGYPTVLPDPFTGELKDYDCQNVTATPPNIATTLKTGDTSCPVFFAGRWWDFCQ